MTEVQLTDVNVRAGHPSPPAVAKHRAVKKAVAELRRRADERAKAQTHLARLRAAGKAEAEAEQKRRDVAAKRAGRDLPEPDAIAEWERELAAAQRELGAAGDLVAEARAAVEAAVNDHREAIAKDLDRRRAEHRAAYVEAVEAIERAEAELGEVEVAARWLDGGRYRAGAIVGRSLPSLVAPNGDAYPTAAAIAALRERLEPPVPNRAAPGSWDAVHEAVGEGATLQVVGRERDI
jgi:hypothetical protein